MRKISLAGYCFTMLSMLWVGCGALLAADGPVSSTQPVAAPLAAWHRLARMTHDMSRLPVWHIADHPHWPWVIARIIPEPERPIPDPTLKVDENGIETEVQSPAARNENIWRAWTARSGRVHVLDDLGVGRVPDSLFFEVTRSEGDTNDGPHYRGLGEELYDVFDSPGGMVVCNVRRERLGRDEYLPALLIPDTWERAVVDAITRVREKPVILELAPESAESRRRMIQTAGDDNPVIAITAFHILVDRAAIEPERAAALIMVSKRDIVCQATQTLLLLRKRPPAMEVYDRRKSSDLPTDIDGRMQALIAAVDAAADFGEVRGIALGAYARMRSPPAHDPYWKAGRALMDHLLKKAAEAKSLTAEEESLQLLIVGLVAQIDRHQ